jgi:predicted PurR-regulated permease PerM
LAALLVLALLYTVWAAKALILPLVLAAFLAIVLSAPVRLLRRLHIPDVLSAGVVVLSFLLLLGVGTYFLSEPALNWLNQAPQVARNLEYKLAPITQKLGGATRELEQIGETSDAPPTMRVTEGSLAATVVERVSSFAAGAVVTIILVYFLLAMGRRTVVQVARAQDPQSRRVSADIISSVQTEIAIYLQTITAINIGLGAATAAAMWATGMPSPALWGVVAGVLNFMPYLGPVITVGILSVVSLLTFNTLGAIALPPLVFLALTTLEGQLLTPMIVGRRLTLNPLVVFLSVVAWGWLWGVAGALLAVPLVAVFKIVLDRTGHLKLLRAAME